MSINNACHTVGVSPNGSKNLLSLLSCHRSSLLARFNDTQSNFSIDLLESSCKAALYVDWSVFCIITNSVLIIPTDNSNVSVSTVPNKFHIELFQVIPTRLPAILNDFTLFVTSSLINQEPCVIPTPKSTEPELYQEVPPHCRVIVCASGTSVPLPLARDTVLLGLAKFQAAITVSASSTPSNTNAIVLPAAPTSSAWYVVISLLIPSAHIALVFAYISVCFSSPESLVNCVSQYWFPDWSIYWISPLTNPEAGAQNITPGNQLIVIVPAACDIDIFAPAISVFHSIAVPPAFAPHIWFAVSVVPPALNNQSNLFTPASDHNA